MLTASPVDRGGAVAVPQKCAYRGSMELVSDRSAGRRVSNRLAPTALAILAAVTLTVFSVGRIVSGQQDDQGSPRASAPLTILQINDVYSMLAVDDQGGLARVATLKERIAATGRTPFLVLAGDFLSSSVESTVFKGAQMIAALNAA